jgi:hypothetical protein
MSARLFFGTRTSERVLRCVRSKKKKRCRKDSGTSNAMSPVFSAHRTFVNSWERVRRTPRCRSIAEPLTEKESIQDVCDSLVRTRRKKWQLRCEVRDNRNLRDLDSKLCQLPDAAIRVPCLACYEFTPYRGRRHIPESQLSRPLDPYT